LATHQDRPRERGLCTLDHIHAKRSRWHICIGTHVQDWE